MRILVTGASGFIGQAVLGKLLNSGHDVIATYSQNPISSIDFSSNSNFFHLNIVKLDLLSSEELVSNLSGCDCVVHLAYNFRATEQEQMEFATRTTEALLTACAQVKIKKIVYASTISVYGEPPRSGSINEESPRLSSIQAYALSKQVTEKMFLESDIDSTEIVILQPSIVYGPGKGGWAGGLLTQMQSNLFPLVNEGSGYCNPIYVDDVAQAIVQACETPVNLHKQCFLISNDEPVTWKEFLSSYEAILGTKTLIKLPDAFYKQFSPVRRHRRIFRKGVSKFAKLIYGKPIQYYSAEQIRFFSAQPIFSNHKARELLNFQPQTSLAAGMEKVQQWWYQQSQTG